MLSLTPSDRRRCVGIVILEDSIAEGIETFAVNLLELDLLAVVRILDDDGTYL